MCISIGTGGGSFELDVGTSGSIKCGEFLDPMSFSRLILLHGHLLRTVCNSRVSNQESQIFLTSRREKAFLQKLCRLDRK